MTTERPPTSRTRRGPAPERGVGNVNRRAWRIFAGLWLGGIALYTALSLLPVRIPYTEPVFWGIASVDEALHVAAFLALAVSLAFVFRSRVDLFLAYLLLLLLGMATELSHLLIPNRAFSVRDLAANVLGCVAGSLPGLSWRFARRVRGKAPLNVRGPSRSRS